MDSRGVLMTTGIYCSSITDTARLQVTANVGGGKPDRSETGTRIPSDDRTGIKRRCHPSGTEARAGCLLFSPDDTDSESGSPGTCPAVECGA